MSHIVKLSNYTGALLALFLLMRCSVTYCAQPSYQVSLYVHLHPKGAPIHYCNGVIVQSRIILTAATCTYFQQAPGEPTVQINPDMITVVVGANNNALNELNTFKVQTFEIARGFDSTTLANDVALLRLDSFLPLGARQDINWIILDAYDAQINAENIKASFPSLNLHAEYAQKKRLSILESPDCAVRGDDICTQYPGSVPADNCQALFSFPAFNGDRGTGLISRSQLIGIFSTVVPLPVGKVVNCTSQQPTKALFTSLNSHLDWIYDVIASDAMSTAEDDNIAFSAPYEEQKAVAAIRQVLATVESIDSTSTDASTIDYHYQALISAGHGTMQKTKCTDLLIALVALCTLLLNTYNS